MAELRGRQTSWGVSTRMVGGVIMSHGDDKGLMLPPHLAPIQVVVLPILKGKTQDAAAAEAVTSAVAAIRDALDAAGVRVRVDDSDKSPGWKFNHWEMKGVPLRIEVGQRDVASESCVVARRDKPGKEGKSFGVPIAPDSLVPFVKNALDEVVRSLKRQPGPNSLRTPPPTPPFLHSASFFFLSFFPFFSLTCNKQTIKQFAPAGWRRVRAILIDGSLACFFLACVCVHGVFVCPWAQHESLLGMATAFRDANLARVGSYEELVSAIGDGKWAVGYWCGSDEDEVRIKEETGATLRCIPLDQAEATNEGGGKCLMTGKHASEMAVFAKAY